MPKSTPKTQRRNSGLTGEYQAIGIKAVAAAAQFAGTINSREETSSPKAQKSLPHGSRAAERKMKNSASEDAVSTNTAGWTRKGKQP